MSEKILCVDDDEKLLRGLERQLSDDFDFHTAVGPKLALELMAEQGPFAVVVSDMRMPDMNGVEFLKLVRVRNPETVRFMLTGFADLNTAMEAVNQGNIFRFLSKPCNENDMVTALHEGLKQYRLIRAEMELVEGTLRGSIQVLSSVLSLVSPLAFGQASRVRQTSNAIARRLNLPDSWQLDIAALLSGLGCVAIPEQTLQKRLAGKPLTAEEQTSIARHPLVGAELLKSIPRLEAVSEMVASQALPDEAFHNQAKTRVPFAAKILRMAIEFDLDEIKSESPLHALNEFRRRNGACDQSIVDALIDYVKNERVVESVEMRIHELESGMVLAKDILMLDGGLLISKGQEIHQAAKERLMNYARSGKVREPIHVIKVRQESLVEA